MEIKVDLENDIVYELKLKIFEKLQISVES